MPMREQIKDVAVELLVRDGCRGLRFADIAQRFGITRANVHYHFGTKERLIEDVVADYVEGTVARYERIWTHGDASLEERIGLTIAFNRERYERFNHGAAHGGHPWSLIARMRLERDLLSEPAKAALAGFGNHLDTMMTKGVEAAKARGELDPEAPVRDIALQLVSIANSAGSITMDTGGFEVLEQLYLGFARILAHAYGRQSEDGAAHARLARVG